MLWPVKPTSSTIRTALERHRRRLAQCRLCPDVQGPPVQGGPVLSPVLLVGQAPGDREIVLRRPFAWTAGKTLFQWFSSIGVEESVFRARVHMSAVCRCFPGKKPKGGDRVPSGEEIENCAPWLSNELSLLRPRLVLPVGKLAITRFVPVDRLAEVVGRSFSRERSDIRFDVVPLPHPSGASTWHRTEPGRTLLQKRSRVWRRIPHGRLWWVIRFDRADAGDAFVRELFSNGANSMTTVTKYRDGLTRMRTLLRPSRWAVIALLPFGFATVASGLQDTRDGKIAAQAGDAGDDEPSVHWPAFRGGRSIPVAHNERLPSEWSTSKNVEWVSDVPGVGWSSPVVWGNRVFLTSATSDKAMKQPSLGTDFSNDYIAELRAEGLPPEEINRRLFERDRELPNEIVIRLMLYCFDLDSGRRLWEREMYHGRPKGGRHRKNSFASETPVTDGEHVYVYLTHHGLFAFDLEGEPVWQTPLSAHPTVRDFGTGASPALLGERIFVLNDNEEQGFIAAFDKTTGNEVWRRERVIEARRKTSWSTPYVWHNELRDELVTSGPGVVISYDLDGEELWRMHRMAVTAIQTPFAWDGLLYVTSGSSAGDNRPLVAIRPGARGDITLDDKQKSNKYIAWWDRLAGGTYLPTPLVYQGGLYVLTEKGILSKHDPKTGERLYRARVAPGAGAFTSSPWAYNGFVFALGEEGDTYVIEAGDEYRLARVNRLDEWTLASPAIVGDRLLIRTQTHLYSIRK